MTSTTTQAPSRNFVVSATTTAIAVITEPTPFSVARHRQPDGRFVAQWRTRPIWRDREPDEHADREHRNQLVRLPVHRDQQQSGENRERDDAVAVHRALGPEVEQMRQPMVLGEDAHQNREATEAGVRREAEDEGHGDVGDVERPPGAERAGGRVGRGS